ncbi:FAD:protein FMN transferase [Prolixibacteraceae bacterium Z1-6]|uniref:FAD:protein FMN transferase n=1 Tax=Draconibacterium aestuarii TaxID=2998507 RepID=A0A9X3J5H5_9BACT|nr:FAD:protein FMN transferase [Prolixibacteraceae bacterium Z1-6]
MPESRIFSDTFLALGAPCDVVLPQVDAVFAKKVFLKVKTEIEQLENNISHFSTLSAIWNVNSSPKNKWISVSSETWEILMICKDFYEMSNGAFDITTAPLLTLWKENESPTDEEIENARNKCGFDKLELDDENKKIRFTVEGMELDFSSIEKGYALDIVKPILTDMGVQNAIINFQEEAVLALGNHPGGEVWPLGIRNQRNPREFNHVFPTSNQAVITAGTIFIRDDGEGIQKRQIISPATGLLIEGDRTVSVKSDSATMGEFIAHIWLILPENDKEILAENFENIEILEVDYLDDDIRTKLSIL